MGELYYDLGASYAGSEMKAMIGYAYDTITRELQDRIHTHGKPVEEGDEAGLRAWNSTGGIVVKVTGDVTGSKTLRILAANMQPKTIRETLDATMRTLE